jgi:hypothetical protein
MTYANHGQVGFGTTITATTAQWQSIDIGGVKVNMVDVTNGASPNKACELLPSKITGQPTKMKVLFDKTSFASAWANIGADFAPITITFPDSSTYVFSGSVEEIGNINITPEKEISADLTFAVSGLPTYSVGSSSSSSST